MPDVFGIQLENAFRASRRAYQGTIRSWNITPNVSTLLALDDARRETGWHHERLVAYRRKIADIAKDN